MSSGTPQRSRVRSALCLVKAMPLSVVRADITFRFMKMALPIKTKLDSRFSPQGQTSTKARS
jgi:hypothetical protein